MSRKILSGTNKKMEKETERVEEFEPIKENEK
jgi:hypothetical protein